MPYLSRKFTQRRQLLLVMMKRRMNNPQNTIQTLTARESPADALKRRVYILVILIGLPGTFTAWQANRLEQPFLANAYIALGLGCLFGLIRILNPKVSVVWVERYGFAMTVMIALTNLVYTDYFASRALATWRDSRETSHWLIAHLCVFAYLIFDTRTGLRVAISITMTAFFLSLFKVLPGFIQSHNSSELVSLVRYTSISGAMLAFTYLLAFTKSQLSLERVKSGTDDLTGLANRRALYATLEKTLKTSSEAGLAIVLFDIDHFKRINDTFGHATGDEVLIAFAKILRQTTPPDAHSGRWGGEEFLIVLPNTNLESACVIAENLRATLERQVFSVGQVTASFGVASSKGSGSLNELVKRADLGLYAAKSRGRNRVETQARLIDQFVVQDQAEGESLLQ
jgi:diguanylate cyclase